MKITIKSIYCPVTFNVEPSHTIAMVKALFLNHKGISASQQRLLHNGTILEDDKTLQHYGIGDGTEIHLALKIGD
ncbi:uncharacterized protein LOC120423627 [Culex pipiens pallens]|uniref:uncharacterized protein LOC120423627 n=1 Tax=Culex pipiens pallens TaxID=42434 RepID=UPI001953D335|nr:uncharacterized protein LOC120423627 [Culex pipiens pallens]